MPLSVRLQNLAPGDLVDFHAAVVAFAGADLDALLGFEGGGFDDAASGGKDGIFADAHALLVAFAGADDEESFFERADGAGEDHVAAGPEVIEEGSGGDGAHGGPGRQGFAEIDGEGAALARTGAGVGDEFGGHGEADIGGGDLSGVHLDPGSAGDGALVDAIEDIAERDFARAAFIDEGGNFAAQQTDGRLREEGRGQQRDCPDAAHDTTILLRGGECHGAADATILELQASSTHRPMLASALTAAGEWLLTSGIQDARGGVARYHMSDVGLNKPVSNEITGYAASTYAVLFEATGEQRYLDAAARTAAFLVEHAWRADIEQFPFENDADSPLYFFDCGIMVRGLLAVWRLTKEQRLLDVAAACGRSMARDFLTEEAIHPVVSAAREPLPYEKRWSREPGCLQLKSAMAWHDLAEVTGDDTFTLWYERALRMALDNYPEFLPGAEEQEQVMDRLHAFSYFMEGVLPRISRPQCKQALREAIGKTSRYLREIRPVFERSDVNAQLLRARLFAEALGVEPLNEKQAAQEARAIAGFQRENGSFCFGRKAGVMMPFDNPVSTGFCLQALTMWQQRAEGKFVPRIEAII